jgi:hypothetical protein
MPIFTIEVAEVVVYRGQVEAETEAEARAAAVDDLIANAGAGRLVFAEVADRMATVVEA